MAFGIFLAGSRCCESFGHRDADQMHPAKTPERSVHQENVLHEPLPQKRITSAQLFLELPLPHVKAATMISRR